MQNSRLSELEKLLAKTNAQPSPRIKSSDMSSSAEVNGLKQEIRVVSAELLMVNVKQLCNLWLMFIASCI